VISRLFRALSVLLCVASCSSQTLVAKQAASPELNCPTSALNVQELEDDRFRVEGCSRSGVYQCIFDQCWREGWLARKARERATREFDCAPDQVHVRWIQEETYRVQACGQVQMYSCTDDNCVPEGGRRPAPTVIPVPIVVR
jgi:hypothetical protein